MKRHSRNWWIFAFAASLSAGAMGESTTNVERTTNVSQGLVASKGTEGTSKKQSQTQTIGKQITAGTSGRSQRKSASVVQSAVNQDFWIYDARTAILNDFDGDGFFTRLELSFDADTAFEGANVFAVLYLSLEGGEWIEYGETLVFDIFGSSANDEYFFDTDLVSGFPRGYYDVLIELYDDYDQRLVAVFGPADSADLFDLPLESETTDGPVPPVVIVTEEGGGGSNGLWASAALALLLSGRALFRRKRLRVAV